MEAIDNGIFNAKRDYTRKEDLKKVKEKGVDKLKKVSKNSNIFTIIAIINILLILILSVSVGFNFGTVIALVLLFLFRKMYLKFDSLFSIVGAGLALSVLVFFSVAIFTKSDGANKNSGIENPNITKDIAKDDISKILEKVLEVTNTSDKTEESVLIRVTNKGTRYYKGKGIGLREVESDLIRKISPLMKNMGFDVSSAGEVGGNQQLGGEKYQKENIICDAMSGVYAKNFTNPTSSFSFSCAYIKDGANSYTEAMEIKLDY